MIKDLMKKRKMNIRQLSQVTGIGYSYIYKMVNEQSDLKKCKKEKEKKIADALQMSLDDFYEEIVDPTPFLHFRSNIQHMVKEGEEKMILYIIDNSLIPYYIEKNDYLKGLYLLALLDYLCIKNGYPCVREYDEFRVYKLNEPFYPTLAAKETKEYFKDKVIPEFLKYNIWEVSIYDVA